MSLKSLVICLISLFATTTPLFSRAAPITTDISNRSYADSVIKQINSAQKSILIAMYAVYVHDGTTGNPVDGIISALISARKRGVAVQVYLDNSPDSNKGNYQAYQTLSAAGIAVAFINSRIKLHAKLIVIDEAIVIEGSANWTRSALLENFENNTLIRSPESAKTKQSFFDELAKNIEPINPIIIDPNAVKVPAVFLTSDGFAPRMVTGRDPYAFDLYLIFLSDNKKLLIDYPSLIQSLKLKGKYSQNMVYQALQRLKNQYHLIDFTIKENTHPKHPQITLVPLTGATVSLPRTYWDYGLNDQLGLNEKFTFLVCLNEQALSIPCPYWSLSEEDLNTKYHLSSRSLSRGLRSLEQQDILEISESEASDSDFTDRTANQYRLKPLISPQEKELLWKQLQENEGKDKVARACAYAAKLGEENNLDTVKAFIRFIKQYQPQAIEKALTLVAGYRNNNPLKNIYYLEEVIKNNEH